MKITARVAATLVLLLACAFCPAARGQGRRWASARERGLKGAVSVLSERCSRDGGRFETGFKYEFARDGKLTAISSFQDERPAYYVAYPGTHRIDRRDGRGGPAEVSFFIRGDLERKERYEIEYDSAGNWTKWVTRVMRDYEAQGAGTAGKWLFQSDCRRSLAYHP